MPLSIRRMMVADIPLGMRLVEAAGWNQIEADWRTFLSLDGEGCFVALWNGQPVGTTVACRFETVGWIAMVLVDPNHRGQGIGTELVRRGIEYLEGHGVHSVRLDATELGRPVYEKLGFTADYWLDRWESGTAGQKIRSGTRRGDAKGEQPQEEDSPEIVEPGRPSEGFWQGIVALDYEATGTLRRGLLEARADQQSGALRVWTRGPRLDGYLLWREGRRAIQIGPVVARNRTAGKASLTTALGASAGRGAFLDIPADHTDAAAWAIRHGFQIQRRFLRMTRGPKITERLAWVWATSGPELG